MNFESMTILASPILGGMAGERVMHGLWLLLHGGEFVEHAEIKAGNARALTEAANTIRNDKLDPHEVYDEKLEQYLQQGIRRFNARLAYGKLAVGMCCLGVSLSTFNIGEYRTAYTFACLGLPYVVGGLINAFDAGGALVDPMLIYDRTGLYIDFRHFRITRD